MTGVVELILGWSRDAESSIVPDVGVVPLECFSSKEVGHEVGGRNGQTGYMKRSTH